MRPLAAILFPFVCLAGLLAWWTDAAFIPRSWFGSPMIAACEASLQERLKAPSTYRRISVGDEQVRNISFDDYFKARGEDSAALKQILIRTSKSQPIERSLLLEYDAANSFGVPLRSRVICSYAGRDRQDYPEMKESVRIDGRTYTEWLVDQANRASALRAK